MAESHFLAAFTPCKSDPEDTSVYHFYPPFVNFTQIGDKVKIMVRARDSINEKGWAVTDSFADMEMPAEEFKALLEKALEKLHVER